MPLTALQENIVETVESRDRKRSLTSDALRRLGQALLEDSYVFTRTICGHRDLIPSIHMPISYLACGLTDRLLETLDMPWLDSYVTRKLRQELLRRRINWRTKEGRDEFDRLINGSVTRPAILNIRMFRRIFKSSVITHGATLFIATRDPNRTIKITHAVDPKAWEFCEQIGRTIQSGIYRDFFPDRIPEGDLSKLITQRRITLGGRTISHPQTTIQASGFQTKEESAHYSDFVTDDLITDMSDLSEIHLAVKWLKQLTGFYMPTKAIRRIEVGTKHDEDDDDTFLTSGSRADEVLTLRVPIEEHTRRVTNILERGKPTCPELFPTEKINAEQAHVLSGEEDEDGYRTWWNQYLLSATGGTLRMFPPDIVDDPDRQWLGPFRHPNKNWDARGHFLVARYARDRNGNPLSKPDDDCYDKHGELLSDWRRHAIVKSFDPWVDMDRVILVDPSWGESSDSDNWGVSCVGQDAEEVKMQLQTLSDTTGIEGWVSALSYLFSVWNPRVWGIDATATQDPMIENVLRNDIRLRRIKGRMVKLHHQKKSKGQRMQEGLAEPLMCYRFLLAPPFREAGADRFGGNITRSELKAIKSTPKKNVRSDQDGIADSLAMSASVIRKARTLQVEQYRPRVEVDPYLGVPLSSFPLTR